jgi:hypothetical protein
MIPIEELKKNFLQTRIAYWKTQRQDKAITVRKLVSELELIQIIVGKVNE